MLDQQSFLQSFLRPREVLLEAGDPRGADHELLGEFQKSVRLGQAYGDFAGNFLFEEMMKLGPARRVDLFEVALDRIARTQARPIDYRTEEGLNAYASLFPLRTLLKRLVSSPMFLDEADMGRLLAAAIRENLESDDYQFPTDEIVAQLAQFADRPQVLARWESQIRELRQALSAHFIANVGTQYQHGGNKSMQKLAELLGTQTSDFLERGDAWADLALAHLDATGEPNQRAWRALFAQAQNSRDAKPNAKWLKAADPLLQAVGKEEFLGRARVVRGLWPRRRLLVRRPRGA